MTVFRRAVATDFGLFQIFLKLLFHVLDKAFKAHLDPIVIYEKVKQQAFILWALLLKKGATDRAEDGCSDTGNENLIFCKNPAISIHQYISHQLGMTPRLVTLIICFEVGRFYFKITT